MWILHEVNRQIVALQLRRYMKRARKAHGLSTNLRDVIADYRKLRPEYADKLEQIIFPGRKKRFDGRNR